MSDRFHRRESRGFALILALLALMLLTFLGLTLATTTSTELQIASNYRWSEQALYNAEAGLEAGRIILRGISDWNTILPSVRTVTWAGNVNPSTKGGGANAFFSRPDEWGNPSRNFESWQCDQYGNGIGQGVVLDDSSTAAPYQYKTTIFGRTLTGAFTIWVRRPPCTLDTANLTDYGANNGTCVIATVPTGDDDNLIMVVEGVAPFRAGAAGVQGRAVRVLEVTLSKATPLSSAQCGTRGGQTGGGPEGANFSPCDPVTGGGVSQALGGASVTERSGVQ
jgi:Tfp pilus assembly protein PilV